MREIGVYNNREFKMPNILVLAPYREPTGYGEASRRYIKALISTGSNIACRPIAMSGNNLEPDEAISKTEKNNIDKPDAVLEICPPYMFEKFREPTFGLFFTETDPLPDSWAIQCSNLDGIINPSVAQQDWCNHNINYQVKDYVVNVPANNKDFYEKAYDKPKWMSGETFKFYSIGEDTERKNLRGIIKSYFSAFSPEDPVELIIKTNKNIEVDEIASKCNINQFPKVTIVYKRLSELELAALHKNSNCFVQASYSEGYSIPCFDALFFGKTPIAPDSSGYREFLNQNNSYLVDCREENCYNGGDIHKELFECNKVWFSPNLRTISKNMFSAFNNMENRRAMCGNRFVGYDKFADDYIGRKLIEVLLNGCKKD